MPKKTGFTLIELLIVVSIIGILAAIALFSYQTFLKNSRDAKRQSDLKFIQSALEQYHGDQKYYPQTLTTDSSLSFGGRIYLTKIPKDPTANPDYRYDSSPANCDNTSNKCSGYCLYAKLENITLSSDADCTPPSTYNFGVTKP